MRISLMIEGQEGITWEQWLALAHAAEAAGLDGFFRSDHYRSIFRGDPAGALDAWAILAGLAARTERIRLGTLVSPVTFRHVSVLAKSVTTVDHISQGRVELGIGAGWFESEHEAYGFPFLTTRERLDELDRQLAEIHRQWGADNIWPRPVQAPHPPVIVGGTAKPRTVRAAVRFADEYNTVNPTVAEARARKQVLDAAASEVGREPLRFSIFVACIAGRDEREAQERLRLWHEFTGLADPPRLVGTVEQLAGQLEEYKSVGVERAMLQHLLQDDVEMVGLLGELANAVSGALA